MSAGDRILDKIRLAQAQSPTPQRGPGYRWFWTDSFELPQNLRDAWWPAATPATVGVTLLGLVPESVVFRDAQGQPAPPAQPLRFRVFRRDDALCVVGAQVGTRWDQCVVIPIVG